jgi:hypothetical protein
MLPVGSRNIKPAGIPSQPVSEQFFGHHCKERSDEAILSFVTP